MFSSALGNSVVDYAITDMDPSYFSAFNVRWQTLFSDHNQINIYLKMTNQATNTCIEPDQMYKINPTYRWSQDSAEKSIQALNSPELNNKITNFNNQQFYTDGKSINLAVQAQKMWP